MQFVRYTTGGASTWGVREDDEIHVVSTAPDGEPSYDDLANPSYRERVAAAVAAGRYPTVPGERVALLAPVPRPGKIVCVGRNYSEHASEQDEETMDRPMLFGKAPTAVTDPEAPIVHPPDVDHLDYEVELAVVIGREATDVPAEEALEYVAGYTVLNDVTARDVQSADGQFLRGKSYDTFAPMGPALATTDAVDPDDLDVELRVNGTRRQQANTGQLIFDVPTLLSYTSHSMTLRPGDVLSTGTPGGVGMYRDPPALLEPGDDVLAEVDGLGALHNPVVASRR